MPYVPATCPHCTGELRLDTEMEKGYCIHCGSMINFADAVKTVRITKPIEFVGYESLPTLLNIIENDFKGGTNQTPEFKQRLIRAMELDPDNQYLYDLVHSQIWKAKIEDNALVQYDGDAKKVTVPEGIVSIGEMAFARHFKLEEITLPKSIKHIMPGAFVYEGMLTINAYKNTYSAQYALASPAKLNLLDFKNSNEKNLESIESILREFGIFKRITEEKIEHHFNKAYSTKWLVVFLILLPALIILFKGFSSVTSLYTAFIASKIYSGPMLLSVIYIIIVVFLLIIKIGYDEILRKIAVKRQIKLFIKKCNHILKPLGIIDFKYHRNIMDEPDVDLEHELKKLEIARSKVLNMSLIDVYKKPDIDFSFKDFIKGHRPSEYKDN